jgi:hypothetical protein
MQRAGMSMSMLEWIHQRSIQRSWGRGRSNCSGSHRRWRAPSAYQSHSHSRHANRLGNYRWGRPQPIGILVSSGHGRLGCPDSRGRGLKRRRNQRSNRRRRRQPMQGLNLLASIVGTLRCNLVAIAKSICMNRAVGRADHVLTTKQTGIGVIRICVLWRGRRKHLSLFHRRKCSWRLFPPVIRERT